MKETPLDRIAALLDALPHLEILRQQILKNACQKLKASSGLLAFYHEPSKRFTVQTIFAKGGFKPSSAQIELGRGILGSCGPGQKIISLPHCEKDRRYLHGVDDLAEESPHSLLAAPLHAHSKLIGLIALYHKAGGKSFSNDDNSFMKDFSREAALMLQKGREIDSQQHRIRMETVSKVISGLTQYLKHLLHGISGGAAFVDNAIRERNMTLLKKGWHTVRLNEKRIANLVRDLLYLSSDKKPVLISTNLGELVQDVVSLLKRQALEKEATLKLQAQEGLPEIPADPIALHRALHHVISNAIDSLNKHHGKVSVLLYSQPSAIHIEVQDTGHGIAPENMRKIFEPFFSTKEHLGTGIGLAVTKKVVEEHGGSIDLRSKLDQGTTLTIKLPVKLEKPAAAKKEKAKPAAKAKIKKKSKR